MTPTRHRGTFRTHEATAAYVTRSVADPERERRVRTAWLVFAVVHLIGGLIAGIALLGLGFDGDVPLAGWIGGVILVSVVAHFVVLGRGPDRWIRALSRRAVQVRGSGAVLTVLEQTIALELDPERGTLALTAGEPVEVAQQRVSGEVPHSVEPAMSTVLDLPTARIHLSRSVGAANGDGERVQVEIADGSRELAIDLGPMPDRPLPLPVARRQCVWLREPAPFVAALVDALALRDPVPDALRVLEIVRELGQRAG